VPEVVELFNGIPQLGFFFISEVNTIRFKTLENRILLYYQVIDGSLCCMICILRLGKRVKQTVFCTPQYSMLHRIAQDHKVSLGHSSLMPLLGIDLFPLTHYQVILLYSLLSHLLWQIRTGLTNSFTPRCSYMIIF
jgi:hypothetical protein